MTQRYILSRQSLSADERFNFYTLAAEFKCFFNQLAASSVSSAVTVFPATSPGPIELIKKLLWISPEYKRQHIMEKTITYLAVADKLVI